MKGFYVVVIALAIITLIVCIRTRSCKPYTLKKPKKILSPNKTLAKDISEVLSDAVKISTTKDDGEENMLKFHAFLEERFPKTFENMEKMIIEQSLLLKFSGSDKKLKPMIFCAHMDIVAVDEENWSIPAFEGIIKDGNVYGRGTIDCKNTVVSLLKAMERLLSKGFESKRDIYFAFGHDEEVGGTQGAAKIVEYLQSKNIKPEFVLDEGGHIEPNYMGIKNFTCAVINVYEKGIINLKLTKKDKGGHASTPEKHTGLGILCEAVTRIEACSMKPHIIPVVDKYLEKVIPAKGYFYCLMFSNKWIFKKILIKILSRNIKLSAMFSNTVAVTMAEGSKAANILPQNASCILNCRVLPGTNNIDVVEYIKRIVSPLGVHVEIISSEKPEGFDSYNSSAYLEITKSIKRRFGDEIVVAPGVMAGGADAHLYQKICDNVFRFMPVVLTSDQYNRMHGNDECIPIDSLGAATEFYTEFINKMANI